LQQYGLAPTAKQRANGDRSSMQSRYTAWLIMIAIDIAIFPALFAYKLFFSQPNAEYLHLLVTYHFGFAKRAFIGSVLSLFTATVPVVDVYGLGLAAWLTAAGLFVLAFKRLCGFDRHNIPLFAFVFGSPFFLKNFMYSIGYFDIYGCIVGFIALLIPAGVTYPLLIGAACIVLLLIHHLHFLLYVPTICFIAFVRYYWLPGGSPLKIAYGLAFGLILAAVFVAVAFFGNIPVPQETLLSYVRERASDPVTPDLEFWYSTIPDEMRGAWAVFHRNVWRIPIFAALIALHLPVIRWFGRVMASLAGPDRRMTLLAIAGISFGYLIIFAVVFDYARWVSNWGTCMVLVVLAARLIPSAAGATEPPITPGDRTSLVLGWIITFIPRVGITKPF
jgi:hypothetical protein